MRIRSCALLALTLLACDDSSRVSTPTIPSTPTEVDSGSSTGGWGDTSTTRRPGKLRLAQLNVRRFFDDKCDSGQCSAGGFEEQATPQQFADRAAQIASALSTLQADVITLAEVETQGCLDAVKAKLAELGYEYPIAKVAEIGTPGSVDVAILARGKLDALKTHRQETDPLLRPDGTKTSFTRELPEAHLTLGSSKVIVFAAHFRSKAGDDDPGRRLAEATKTQELVVAAGAANTGALVLLGGDLNDTPGSDPINALEKGGALVRVAKDLPTASQGTYKFSGVDQAIDHIFTTSALSSAYISGSTTVMRDSSSGFGGSDHAAIYADFTLPN